MSLNLLVYSIKSSPFLCLVACRVASVTVSSPCKYLVQNTSTISSQVGIDPSFRPMYQVYAQSHSNLENSQRHKPSRIESFLRCSGPLLFQESRYFGHSDETLFRILWDISCWCHFFVCRMFWVVLASFFLCFVCFQLTDFFHHLLL